MHETKSSAGRMETVVLASSTISSLLLNSGVIACILYVLFTLASLLMVKPASEQTASTGVRLEAGMHSEDAEGDLPIVQDFVDKPTTDNDREQD